MARKGRKLPFTSRKFWETPSVKRKNFLVYFQLSFYDIYYELCPHLEDSDGNSNNSPTSSSKTAENGRRGNLGTLVELQADSYFLAFKGL
jgi:hypothetical protein